MTNIELHTLSSSQRRKLQLGVLLLLAVFLVSYLLSTNNKLTTKSQPEINKEVYLQGSKLYIFDDVYTVKPYPDKILVHNPYLLIVQADKPLTVVYNLETQKKETEIADILLDYYQGNTVYTRQTSYFNAINLGKYCDAAFIRNPTDVLCITKQSREGIENMLIKINPQQPSLWIQEYRSNNVLTTVSVINNEIYTGEINIDTKQNYISVNKQLISVENTVNAIYPLENTPFFVSFKSELNQNKESYYQINNNRVTRQQGDKIYFYK